MKILLTGGHSSFNNGEVAMVMGTVQMLRAYFPDASFTIYSRRPQVDSGRYAEVFEGDTQVRVIGLHSRLLRILSLVLFPLSALLRLLVKKLTRRHINWPVSWSCALGAFGEADLVVDLSGDSFTDDYGAICIIIHGMSVLTAVLLQKPTVIFAQSMGPFRSRFTKGLVKRILNHVDLILVRERITFDLLVRLGVSKSRLFMTADSAFVLPKLYSDRVKAISGSLERPLVGINISRLASNWAPVEGSDPEAKYLFFIESMARFVDMVIEKMGCYVLLTPHRFGPGEKADDRVTLRHILDKMTLKDRTILLTQDYMPMEIKALIGECDLFVGARMHSNIAALSQSVPTVAISYSHKTQGIMELLGVREWVYDIRDFDIDCLVSLCEKAFDHREQIKAGLEARLPEVIEQAWRNAELVSTLFSGDPPRKD